MQLTHLVRLRGPRVRGARLAAPLLRDFMEVVVEGCRRSLRLRLDGHSTARGAPPSWLASASDFDVELRARDDAAEVIFESPALKDVLRAKPIDLLSDEEKSHAALDIFGASLRDAAEGQADSDRFDQALIETLSELGRVVDDETEIDFLDGCKLHISANEVASIRGLRGKIPAPQAVRVTGKLDAIRHSDRMFELVLARGEHVRGVAGDNIPLEALAALFGKQAMVTGQAHFRPSGKLLRVDATNLELPQGGVTLFSVPPSPPLSGGGLSELRELQSARNGLAAIIGKWPGDETDAEVEDYFRTDG